MLYYVSTAEHAGPIWDFVRTTGWRNVPFFRPVAYEDLFHRRRVPIGNYIFTDFDRLTAYEVRCAAHVANIVQAADPRARIYNHPVRTLERYPLLRRLHAEGLNSFTATRLDAGERPAKWPVFIRCEDDCEKPDTGLIHDEAEYDAALAKLATAGVPLKRRIAVEYKAQPTDGGFFRKYGAIRMAGSTVLQHIFYNRDWYVKHGIMRRDGDDALKEFVDLFDNFEEHSLHLNRAFDLAGIQYGRADYSVVDGRIEIYEINTNPTIRGPGRNTRRRTIPEDRRGRLVPALVDGFTKMNATHDRGTVAFVPPEPVFQNFHGMHWQVHAKLTARMLDAARFTFRAPVKAVRQLATAASLK